VVHNNSSHVVIVGNRYFLKKNRGAWVTITLSAKALAAQARAQDPYTSLARFDKLSGVRRVSPGHYSVTGPFAKISPFVRYEFQLASDAFAGTGTKTLTVTMTLDSGAGLSSSPRVAVPRTMCSPRPGRSAITTSR
jgi:hypothetical protein